MMKKLLVFTAVVALTAGTVGCNCCDWFRRGALFPTATTATVAPEGVGETYYPANPCDPCTSAAPCDPCAPGSYETMPPVLNTTPSTVLPGPGPAAAPSQ
jgi:hypothetical protein